MGLFIFKMYNPFTRHPHEVDESYFQHMLSALRYATVFLLLFFVAIIHAVFPFIFRKTSSIAIQEMVKHIESREVV
jgi:hypothetical protein